MTTPASVYASGANQRPTGGNGGIRKVVPSNSGTSPPNMNQHFMMAHIPMVTTGSFTHQILKPLKPAKAEDIQPNLSSRRISGINTLKNG